MKVNETNIKFNLRAVKCEKKSTFKFCVRVGQSVAVRTVDS